MLIYNNCNKMQEQLIHIHCTYYLRQYWLTLLLNSKMILKFLVCSEIV